MFKIIILLLVISFNVMASSEQSQVELCIEEVEIQYEDDIRDILELSQECEIEFNN